MYNELKNKVFYSNSKNTNNYHTNNNSSEKKVANRFDSLSEVFPILYKNEKPRSNDRNNDRDNSNKKYQKRKY
jgi:hypothetical protein